MSRYKLPMKTDLQHARDLGRDLQLSGASGVEIVDAISDAFDDELVRLAAYRAAYAAKVGTRIRAAKEVHHG